MAPVDPSLIISSGSVLIAMAALVLSVRQPRRQHPLPVALDIFRESRSPEWSRARDWVITSLGTEHSPHHGVSGLPEPAREQVRRVVFFYDDLGVFVAYNVIGQDLAIGFHGVGLSEAWSVLEPYIRRERHPSVYCSRATLVTSSIPATYRAVRLRRRSPPTRAAWCAVRRSGSRRRRPARSGWHDRSRRSTDFRLVLCWCRVTSSSITTARPPARR